MSNSDYLTTFSRGDLHDQRVPVLLTADEYIFVRDYAKDHGISMGDFFRFHLNDVRKLSAQKQLSAEASTEKSARPAQDMDAIVKALAQLLKAHL